MKEYFTEAIVLDKQNSGEFNSQVFLYTKILGRIMAKITSSRKIVSKLNSHLEPLDIVEVRLINKNNFQVADALKKNKLSINFLSIIRTLKELTPEGEPDFSLWTVLNVLFQKKQANLEIILSVLGYDPEFSSCFNCDKNPNYFDLHEMSFYCSNCAFFSKNSLPLKNPI